MLKDVWTLLDVVCAVFAVCCAVAIDVVKLVDKLALLPNDVAISPNVSNIAGAVPTKFDIAVDIAVAVAVETGFFKSDVLCTFPKPTPVLFKFVKFAFESNCCLCCC